MPISIVTIALNDVERIERTIASVLRQRDDLSEYHLVDGGSTDGTWEIVTSYAGAFASSTTERDDGIYDAMNKGIKRCSSPLIGIVNAGDFYFPWTLRTIAEAAQDSDADIFHGDQMVFTTYERFSWFRIQQPNPDINALETKPSIFHPTCFVRRSLYERIGYFDTRYRVDADYEFLLRAKRSGAKFQYIPRLLTGFESGGISGGCTRYSEGYKILKDYNIPRYTSNTVKLLRCLMMKAIGHVVNLEQRLERKRLQEAMR